jgi:beta-lactamase regulating signal transducer with metallopeptidase domain
MTGLLLTLLAQGTLAGAAALAAAFLLRRYPPRLRMAILGFGVCSFAVPLKVATRNHMGALAAPSPLLALLLAVAAAGALVALERLAIEALALHRLLARTAPAGAELQHRATVLAGEPVTVRLTAECHVPFVASGKRIVLPHGLDDERLDAILLHELAHLRGGDVAVNRLLAVFSALLWFHPVARLLVRALRQALEERCDDFALRQADAYAYAETLVELAASLPSPSAALAMASRETRSLATRLRRIAEQERQVTTVRRCVLALVLVAAPLVAGAVQLAPRFAITTHARHIHHH